MREYFTNIFMIALAIAFLVLFALIAKYGTYPIHEPNVAILSSEIATCAAFIGFGIFNLIKMARR